MKNVRFRFIKNKHTFQALCVRTAAVGRYDDGIKLELSCSSFLEPNRISSYSSDGVEGKMFRSKFRLRYFLTVVIN